MSQPQPTFRNRWILIIWAGILALWGCQTPDPVDQAIVRGQAFLQQIQRPDGAICDTVNPLFDVWETVEAAAALSHGALTGRDSARTLALAFLSTAMNGEKLLCHNLKCRKETCIETSAEYLLLLKALGNNPESTQVSALQKWQQPDGHWLVGNPDVRIDTAFPSVTGFALAALRIEGAPDSVLEKAGEWLVKNQHPEGHWGMSWEYYGCPAYALWANIRALEAWNGPEAESALQKAREYILNNQLPDGSWNTTVTAQRKVSPALQTALMLSTLRPTDSREYEAGNRAVDYLLQNQTPQGNWDGGFFPIDNARYQKQEYVFATARAVIALAIWQERSKHEQK